MVFRFLILAFIIGFCSLARLDAQWVKVSSSGNIPQNAFRGGHEADQNKTPLYIARAPLGQAILVGKAHQKDSKAFFSHQGQEVQLGDYQVYVGTGLWVMSNNGEIPKQAVEGGRSEDGKTLYIARVGISGGYHIGKIAKGGKALIPYGGLERAYTGYEVLICPDPKEDHRAFQFATDQSVSTKGNRSLINRSWLHANTKAIIFAMPTYQGSGDGNATAPYAIERKDGQWYIAIQNESLPIVPVGASRLRFNLLAFVGENDRAFVHTSSNININDLGTRLNHPDLNGKPEASLLITQRLSDGAVKNDHPIGVKYRDGAWHIVNLDGVAIPSNAKFNVLVTNKNTLKGAQTTRHSKTAETSLPAYPFYTHIEQPFFNRNQEIIVFATPDAEKVSDPNILNVWYDRPDDGYVYKNERWFIYNASAMMPQNATFHIIGLPVNTPDTDVAYTEGEVYLINNLSGMALEPRIDSPNEGVELTQKCFGQAVLEKWEIGCDAVQGGCLLRNKKTGKRLDVKNHRSTDGERIVQKENATRWILFDNGFGAYKLQADKTKKFLAVAAGSLEEGDDVIQWGDVGQEDIWWTLFPDTLALPYMKPYSTPGDRIGQIFTPKCWSKKKGWYHIRLENGKALEVKADCALENGCEVQISDFTGNLRQRWEIIREKGGCESCQFTIKNAANGKVLEVSGGQATVNGGRVQLWDLWGGNNQSWDIISLPGTGVYLPGTAPPQKWKISPSRSEKVLEVSGNKVNENGALVHLWEYAGQENQVWLIEEAVGLWGLADLHAHPASHLSFRASDDGHNIFWGRPGLRLEDSDRTIASDLGTCNGDEHSSGDADHVRRETRKTVIRTLTQLNGFAHGMGGWPDFTGWPHSQSGFHQQMHIQWVRRAWEGGLRLMVASVTDNQTLSMLWTRGYQAFGRTYPDPDPSYDYNSARRQLSFIRDMANANSGWMEIVNTPDAARKAIQNNKIAIVLGLELDKLTLDQVLKLADEFGVRQVTPIHFANNAFGGTAINIDVFNTSNWYLNGQFFKVKPDPNLSFRLPYPNLLHAHSDDLAKGGAVEPRQVPLNIYQGLGYDCSYSTSGSCAGSCLGHKNEQGANIDALKSLMRRGMLLDLAHMSEASHSDIIPFAEKNKYPMMNSHTGLREPDQRAENERAMRTTDAATIATLGGVIGIGTAGNYKSNRPFFLKEGRPLKRFTATSQSLDLPLDVVVSTESFNRIEFMIATSGDDLRGGNDNVHAFLKLVDGREVPLYHINNQKGWGNNSTNSKTFTLPSLIKRSQIQSIRLQTTFGGGTFGDNWEMNLIHVYGVYQDDRKERLLFRSANLLKRFTGSDQNWSSDIDPLPGPITPQTMVHRLKIIVKTGGDDLRGGNDNVYAYVGRKNKGAMIIDLNRRNGWSNGSFVTIDFDMPPGTVIGELSSFLLNTTFGGGVGGDNWDMDALMVIAETPIGEKTLLWEHGSPLARFTGETQVWHRDWCDAVSHIVDVAPSTLMHGVILTIATGGDDLRGNNDNVHATLTLSGGREIRIDHVNHRSNWHNGLTFSNYIRFDKPIRRDELKKLRLQTTFSGTFDADNWDVTALRLDAVLEDPVKLWVEGADQMVSNSQDRGIALGTDLNGLESQIPFTIANLTYPFTLPSDVVGRTLPSFSAHKVGNKVFDFKKEGLAHYGMLPDFIKSISLQPNSNSVIKTLYRSAEDLIQMWEKCDLQKNYVR